MLDDTCGRCTTGRQRPIANCLYQSYVVSMKPMTSNLEGAAEDDKSSKPTANEIEAANRAEATALLIRSGYRVYRPEADCFGEDLILRTPSGDIRVVQLKSRPTVDRSRYQGLWMLFPDPKSELNGGSIGREWFLVPHDELYDWIKDRHAHTPKWNNAWSYPGIPRDLSVFLKPFRLLPQAKPGLFRQRNNRQL